MVGIREGRDHLGAQRTTIQPIIVVVVIIIIIIILIIILHGAEYFRS